MNLQDCLDSLSQYGGGILELNPTSTYYLTSDLNIGTNVTINGNGSTFDFSGTPYGIKIIGTAIDHIINPSLKELTIINSTGTGVQTNYVDNAILTLLENVQISNCDIGVDINNGYAPVLYGTFSNNGINCQIKNTDSIEIHFSAFDTSTIGDSLIIENCTSSTFFDSQASNSVRHGLTLKDCTNITFLSSSFNTNIGDGIKFVSGNDRIIFMGNDFHNNTGYGVNIADATTLKTIISSNTFNNNTAGVIHDIGTNTLIRSNQGIVDN